MTLRLSAGKKGFTLLESLMTRGILAVISAVVLTKVTTLLTKGHLAAANKEVASLRTAADGYGAERQLAVFF